MKTVIAGSRTITSYAALEAVMKQLDFPVTEVVSGTARGVDQLGELWARRNGVPVKRFPADWERLGRSAGYHRNVAMAQYADRAVVLWDGVSKGTEMMISLAKRYKLEPVVTTVRKDS